MRSAHAKALPRRTIFFRIYVLVISKIAPRAEWLVHVRVEVTINTLRATVPGTIEPHSACDLCRSVRQENEYYPKMKVNRSIPVLKTLQVRSLTVTAT